MRKFFIILSVLFCTASHAAVDNNTVVRAEKYLNSITGLSGDFVQTSGGASQRGVFSMLRPGRVRLDYKNMPVQLISDGKDLYFYDSSLDQITTVPLTSTPAAILVRKNIDLRNADIVVTETTSDKDGFSLKMNLRGQEGLGNMTVRFGANPVVLKSWTMVDATGAKTDVVFDGLRTKTNFAKGFFELSRHKTVSNSSGDDFYD